MIEKHGINLHLTITGILENIGKTPALNVSYFGKLYVQKPGEALLSEGCRYYSEHFSEVMADRIALANIFCR
ncbi:MAG TPA: hypothetical protein VK148_31060 [Xanthobacteraceae bacterium]|jgi:hypothetical protein|nr:hypothetical protein [Xanthobacteraceae bacterium]